MHQRSSLLTEFGWLALFFAIFVVLVYAFNFFIVPQYHFNDRVAIMLSAIIAGLSMITLRARWRK